MNTPYSHRFRFEWLPMLTVCLLVLFFYQCVEPFEAESIDFESALVIDATITNEVKRHQIKLSRSFALEEQGPSPERQANVAVTDDQGTAYAFIEESPGTYVSEAEFAAQPGRLYELSVGTRNGRSYTSDRVSLTPLAVIDEIFAERSTNSNGVEGVAIRVNASGTSGNAQNYRYTYEETYKIIAPDWTPDKLVGDPEGGCNVLVVPRDEEQQVCYATDTSNSIILTDTNDFAEDRVSRFVVRFISRQNFIISHRYSILVRQMVQSDAAYTFFETLSEFSGSESLFSEIQPGFLEGNVFSEDAESEKVLGYFDVASVTEQRIFFDYADLFPGEPLPPYINPCNQNAPPLTAGMPPRCVLRGLVEGNQVAYVNDNPSPGSTEGPYLVVPRVCGDCTAIGGIVPPEFWTEP